ncbi:MAG: hypothetical protein E7564_11270 [Ruminococcaceae bacterium]|nr:hypothetical protein [Oscillospiraceae bacterium]
MNIRDKETVRELAKKYMELATDEKQFKMNERMKATNDLKLVRPPLLIDEIPWYQMNIDNELTCLCEDEGARGVEYALRIAIYRRKHFKADTILEPFWRVDMAYDSTGIGLQVEEHTRKTDDINNIISHEYIDVLENEEDLEKLKIPQFTRRKDKDEKAIAFYTELLGDSMPVKLCGRGYIYSAPWDIIARFRGMENILYDLYDRPEHLHAIRKRFLEIVTAELDFIEKELHVDPDYPLLHCTPAYVSGLANDGLKATWYRTMAQGFSDISPEMHYEFDVKYSLELSKRFAYTYYGCCEPLDKKLEVISKIENLRKIGVTPWAKEEVMAEWIGGKYVYSKKPNPANVAMITDPEAVRKETEKSVKLAIKYGCPMDITLKDISTVSHRPENLIVWSETVSEVLDKYYGK